MQYPNSIPHLEAELSLAPQSEVTDLAREIIENAKIYDMALTRELKVYPQYLLNGQLIERNYANPIEYTHSSVLGAPGADCKDKPIQDFETWNEGRRATNTGAEYKIDTDGLPINPYLYTGLRGQGLLWQYGPNHAVDNGIMTIKIEAGEPALYAIGINRKDSPSLAAFAGGFAKYEKTAQGYMYDINTVVHSQSEEFFEEMMSGSVELLPEYRDKVADRYNYEVVERMKKRNGVALSEEKLHEIEEQVRTAVKMEQVQEKDPGVFPRLREMFGNAHKCYAGPILNSARNTNNSWIETKLSWVMLSDEKWSEIRGKEPKFDYKLSAGDDAAKVRHFKMDETLIDNADASHKAMFAFMMASYLVDSQLFRNEVPPSILNQAKGMATYLKQKATSSIKPR